MTKQEKQRELNRRRREEMRPAYDALMKCYPLTLNDLEGEQWRPIAGCDGYHVSTYGRVKSFKYNTPHIIKPILRDVYLGVVLGIDGARKWIRVHQLVARAFIPNPENKPQVNHKDACKLNNYVENLEWVTSSENNQHAYNSGLQKSGTARSDAKIKDENDVLYIRENPDGLSTYQLASKFGVDQQTISNIQLGKSYKNAGGTLRDKIDTRTPDEIRNKICADWNTGKYTKAALARKYDLGETTISRIIAETGFAP